MGQSGGLPTPPLNTHVILIYNLRGRVVEQLGCLIMDVEGALVCRMVDCWQFMGAVLVWSQRGIIHLLILISQCHVVDRVLAPTIILIYEVMRISNYMVLEHRVMNYFGGLMIVRLSEAMWWSQSSLLVGSAPLVGRIYTIRRFNHGLSFVVVGRLRHSFDKSLQSFHHNNWLKCLYQWILYILNRINKSSISDSNEKFCTYAKKI